MRKDSVVCGKFISLCAPFLELCKILMLIHEGFPLLFPWAKNHSKNLVQPWGRLLNLWYLPYYMPNWYSHSPATGLPIESQPCHKWWIAWCFTRRTRLYLLAPIIRVAKVNIKKKSQIWKSVGFSALKSMNTLWDRCSTFLEKQINILLKLWWSGGH